MDVPLILSVNNTLATSLNNIQIAQLSLADWQTENLNFVSLRGGWFANSEADFDLEAEIDKFLLPQNNKKLMLLMGDSGSGKSLYTQGLVNKLWQNFSAQAPIPIWISLPSLKDPINKGIEETFEKYGFNKDQIEKLRKTRSFIFILDAYDEIRCEKNLYQTNNLDKWNAKIIFICRREYLYHRDNYKLFFAPFIGDKIQYTQYEEIYIKPFNVNQIQAYIQQYIKVQVTQWNNPERYVKAMDEIKGLKELIKTPFMLKLTMEVLPLIVEKYATQNLQERKKVTQAALYDVFIEQWFIRQEKKLKEAKHIKENEDIKPEFWAYAKELALEMHKANLNQILYNPNEESDLFSTEVIENPWEKFFTPKKPKIELLRTACLVRETSQHHYAFIHLSLLEYFLTRNLYENITTQNKELTANQALIVPAAASSSTAIDNKKNQASQISKSDYFNECLLVKQENTLQFLADRVSVQEAFKQSLFERVYSSKNNSQNKVAAANAITILNKAKIVFSGMDLSGVQIPEADLSYALLHHTNLSGANLQRVRLNQAYLSQANLRCSKMSEIQLGQLPILEHEYYVDAICYSKDGRYLAVTAGHKIILWDPHTKQKCGNFVGHKDRILSVAFSPDSKFLVSGSGEFANEVDNSVRLWSVANQSQLCQLLPGHADAVISVAYSADGKLIASGDHTSIRLWSVAKRMLIGELPMGEFNCVQSLSFSPNSKFLVSGEGNNSLRLWSVEQQTLLAVLNGHTSRVKSVAFSPDGKLLASGSTDNTIIVWDVDKQVQRGTSMTGHTQTVTSVAFSPDGTVLASGSCDNTVRLWSVETQRALGQVLIGHNLAVSCIDFSPDGKYLASSSLDGAVRMWLVEEYVSRQQPLMGHTEKVKDVILSPDCKLLASCSKDNTVRFFSLKDLTYVGQPLFCQGKSVNGLNCVAFSPDGKLLATGGWDATVTLWSVEKQIAVGQLQNEFTIEDLAFSFDGKILAVTCGEAVHLWLVETLSLFGKPMEGHTKSVRSIAFSPNGKLLASASNDKTMRLWTVEQQVQLGTPLTGHIGTVNCVAISPNGKVLASGGGDGDQTVRLWLVDEQKALGQPMTGHTGSVSCLSFSVDSKFLASGSNDRTVRLWSVDSQQFVSVVYTGTDIVTSVNFGSDNRHLVFSQGNTIGLLQRCLEPEFLNRYLLIWLIGITQLAAEGSLLEEIDGLSDDNHRLLIQLGAIAKANKLIPNKPIYSNISSIAITPTLFKPAPNVKTKYEEKAIVTTNNEKKAQDDKKEKEKCKLM